MSKMIDLKPFCAAEQGRYLIDTPWVKGGWKNATDGKLLVRLRTDEPDTPVDEKAPRPNTTPLFDASMNACRGTKSDLLPFPIHSGERDKADCMFCNGTGAGSDVCKTCDGKGECPHCEAICPDCDGTGDIRNYSKACKECDGDGHGFVPMVLDGYKIAAIYARKINTLQNVRYVAQTWPNAMYFVFDGGEGLVMAINPRG